MITHEKNLKIDNSLRKSMITDFEIYMQIFVAENYPEVFDKLKDVKIRIKKRGSLSKKGTFRRKTFSDGTEKYEIIMNEYYTSLNYFEYPKNVYSVLLHEIIHFVCCVKGMNYRDGDVQFENELKKHKVNSSKKTRASKRGYRRDISYIKGKYRYRCSECKRSKYVTKKEKVIKCGKCGKRMYYTNRIKTIEKL